MKIHWLLIQ